MARTKKHARRPGVRGGQKPTKKDTTATKKAATDAKKAASAKKKDAKRAAKRAAKKKQEREAELEGTDGSGPDDDAAPENKRITREYLDDLKAMTGKPGTQPLGAVTLARLFAGLMSDG